jgi:hypothetical protein
VAPVDEAALARAYRDTAYCVDHPAGHFTLRLGEACAPLQALLRKHGAREWAFVSASNPHSRPLSAAANAVRHAQLLARVRAAGWQTFAGRGVADRGDWMEESLLILGIEETAALALGAAFEQYAVVTGHADGVARLRWCVTRA